MKLNLILGVMCIAMAATSLEANNFVSAAFGLVIGVWNLWMYK